VSNNSDLTGIQISHKIGIKHNLNYSNNHATIMDMKNLPTNQAKKLTRLYYQDKIWQLHTEGKSIRDITNLINRHYLPRSKFKGITIGKSSVAKLIANLKEKRKEN